MANQEFVDEQWDELVPQLIGPSPKQSPWWTSNTQSHQGYYNQLTRWQNTRGDLNMRFRRDEDIAGVRNTKWGALMAVQAWEQKDKSQKGIKSQDQRNQNHQAAVMFGKLPMTEKAAKILVANEIVESVPGWKLGKARTEPVCALNYHTGGRGWLRSGPFLQLNLRRGCLSLASWRSPP